MSKLRFKAVVGAVVALIAGSVASYAGGLWWGFPQIGGASYCVSWSALNLGVTNPATATTTSTGSCNATAPAGPALFSGTEVLPVDIYGPQAGNANTVPSSAYVGLVQVGQGPYAGTSGNTASTVTIANNTPFFFISGNGGTTVAVTMPSAPVEGQIQRIICDTITGSTFTAVANTGQTLRNNPSATCVAGVGYAWRYVAASTTWYRFQ